MYTPRYPCHSRNSTSDLVWVRLELGKLSTGMQLGRLKTFAQLQNDILTLPRNPQQETQETIEIAGRMLAEILGKQLDTSAVTQKWLLVLLRSFEHLFLLQLCFIRGYAKNYFLHVELSLDTLDATSSSFFRARDKNYDFILNHALYLSLFEH
uniref:AlNc14C71G4878 protein n=1 Tax=Albugo laibachii Nc14 TaxID=890382 RepID=F0WE16_9STRA|nr:AlNc14C71G4878 [Albugo laibachii Nc14]|eukprot:CCA19445.1 AlNc14C71G4878 [Albugo laibachii Nc14]